MTDDITRLADALDAADQAHAADVTALADLADDQLDYLAHAGDRPDPSTDGIEGRCV